MEPLLRTIEIPNLNNKNVDYELIAIHVIMLELEHKTNEAKLRILDYVKARLVKEE